MSTMRRLEQDGTLIFSNNYRNFDMNPIIFDRYAAEEITDRTVPEDFTRNKRIHRCWIIRLRQRAVPEARKPEVRKPEAWKPEVRKTDAGKTDAVKQDFGDRQKPDGRGRGQDFPDKNNPDVKAAVVKKKVVRQQPSPTAAPHRNTADHPRKKAVRAVTPAKDGAEKSPQKKKNGPDDDSLTLDF